MTLSLTVQAFPAAQRPHAIATRDGGHGPRRHLREHRRRPDPGTPHLLYAAWTPGQHVRVVTDGLLTRRTSSVWDYDGSALELCVLDHGVRSHLVHERGRPRRSIITKPFWTPGKKGME